jgi:hypothetical protein
VVYLVRSSRTYARIRSLTTGTFNLIVKDRIAFRLSGAPSVQPDDLVWRRHCPRRFCLPTKPHPTQTASSRPRNPTTIPCGENPVNQRIPQNFHAFSTSGRVTQKESWSGGRPRPPGRARLDRAARSKTDRAVGFLDDLCEDCLNPHPDPTSASAPCHQYPWNE